MGNGISRERVWRRIRMEKKRVEFADVEFVSSG